MQESIAFFLLRGRAAIDPVGFASTRKTSTAHINRADF